MKTSKESLWSGNNNVGGGLKKRREEPCGPFLVIQGSFSFDSGR